MNFVTAFVLGGALCAFFQLLMMLTKARPPELLIFGLLLGAIITVFGLSDILLAWGGAGFSIMVIGAAQAIFGSFQALFLGKFAPIITVLCIFAALTVLGILAGTIRTSIEKRKAT